MNSAATLYDCRVMHRRLKPKRHAFNYGVFMISFDLDHFPRLPFLGHNRFNLFSIHDADHVNEAGRTTIRENLTDWLRTQGIECPADASIRLLTFPRVLGYGFNPVSFYYIDDADGRPLFAVAEVVNTFREMKLYLVGDRSSEGEWRRRLPKNFYVSPFSDPAAEFDFRLGTPAERWRVNIDVYQNGERSLVSAIHGDRRPLTAARLAGYALRFPLMSLKIVGLIHWQALRLWLKRIPYFAKNANRGAQLDVMRPHSSLNPKSR